MKISEIKRTIKQWHDFYGGDIPDGDRIDAIKTKEDARQVLEAHRTLMEDMLSDAMTHLNDLESRLEL